jgi:NAD(P)H-dependent FMN reductase
MKTIIGIAGSLRTGSFNAALLREAASSAVSGVEVVIKSIAAIPLYNGDEEEQSGIPTPVQELKDAIAAAQGLLLATPEYNNAMPGVLKNAIDWLTRPPSDIPRVFGGKPVAMMGASPGGFGTILAQNAWLPVLRTLGTRPWFGGRLLVSHAHQVFGDGGEITDVRLKEQIRQFVQGFAASL